MKTFSDIPDIGPGAEIYSVSTPDYVEFLFRTTAGFYVLEKCDTSNKRKCSIIDESEAIDWCVQHGKCRGASDFFDGIWKVVCRMPRKERTQYKEFRFLLPRNDITLQRTLELLQLPVFRQCIIRNCEGMNQISASEIDWLSLLAWVKSLIALESFFGPVSIGPGETFERLSSKSSCFRYRATWEQFSIDAQCGYAVAPIEFPMEFDSCKLDQGVWVKVEEDGGSYCQSKFSQIALSALGLLVSSIVLYEIGIDEPVDRTQLPPEKELLY